MSKIVYTLRNAPSQLMTNSIEVPGLFGADYTEFVEECSQEFKVPPPSSEFRDGVLVNMSERRPLVIESVIALVRTSGSYKRAAELFEQHAGEQIRDYVFSREWDALSKESAARSVLAALSDLNQPTDFSQLETVLQINPSRLQDAIGEVREMFLKVDQAGDNALFSLAPLTRQFVASKKDSLQYYSVIRERVKTFKRNVYISNPQVAAEVLRVERLIPPRYMEHSKENSEEAWKIVTDSKLPPRVTEDPLFRSLYGYVAAACTPPRLTEARSGFEYAVQMKFEPEFRYLLAWFAAEKESGVLDRWCERIADIVISGKKYSESEKIEMISRKASSLYVRGRDRLNTDYTEAVQSFREALGLHLRAFRLNCLSANPMAEVSERFARNTMFTLFHISPKDAPWEIIDEIRTLAEGKDLNLDPIESPLVEFLNTTVVNAKRLDIVNRTRARLRSLLEGLSRKELWLANNSCQRVMDSIKNTESTLSRLLK